MKAKIDRTSYNKEVQTKFGTMYQHYIEYDGKRATYLSKNLEQKYFIEGQECEFTEEIKGQFINVKPLRENKGNSNFGRALKREQSKYSGFAMSYAKDLVVHDKIKLDQISEYTRKMFQLMVELDKTLES